MMTFLKLYGLSIPVFFAMDMVWLGLIAPKFYQKHIGHLLKDNINWAAAAVFYLVFLAGLTFFVLEPMAKEPLWHVALRGGLFGLVCYATYDLTNLAVAKNWSLTVTIVDMVWGTVLCTLVATVTMAIFHRFFL